MSALNLAVAYAADVLVFVLQTHGLIGVDFGFLLLLVVFLLWFRDEECSVLFVFVHFLLHDGKRTFVVELREQFGHVLAFGVLLVGVLITHEIHHRIFRFQLRNNSDLVDFLLRPELIALSEHLFDYL